MNKVHFLWIAFIFLFLWTSCSYSPDPFLKKDFTQTESNVILKHEPDQFLVVQALKGDSALKLAKRYLNTPYRAGIIEALNKGSGGASLKEWVIPLRQLRRGGITPLSFKTVAVLVYHDIAKESTARISVSPENFEKQIRYLKEHQYHSITLDQFMGFLEYRTEIPDKSVLITFDDGWRSIYEIAYPILKQYGFTAVLFLYTDFIGGGKALTWRQVKRLASNGFAIHSHSKTHRNLTYVRPEETLEDYLDNIEWEMIQSRKVIQHYLHKKVDYLAYPYGASNSLVVSILKKCGYKAGFTVKRGSNPFFNNPFSIKRQMIYNDDNIMTFQRCLNTFVAYHTSQ